ncbi:MAG TPA: hypothetical protein VHM93_23245 [Candidatus Acidoferrum sp.]|nr:hypothetical protein [Candidatus Acidoferrum sp.]
MTRAKEANEGCEKDAEETKHGEQLYQNAGGDAGRHVIDSTAGPGVLAKQRWPQNGSVRRECLYHIIVFDEAGLCRMLKSHFQYDEIFRTRLLPNEDAPVSRAVEPPALGRVIEIAQVGGLHHLYTRRAT